MKSLNKLIISSIIIAVVSCENFLEESEKSNTKLQFNSTGDFTILQFTDLHYGECYFKDEFSQHLQEKLINHVKPDLVVITGDAVSGYAWDKSDTFYQNCWKKWTNPMLKTKVKYAYTLGNHDDQANLSRQQILDLENTNPFSITSQSRKITGITNYIIPITSSKDSNIPISILWFFDTNDEGCLGHSGWGCINPDQIEWYESISKGIINQAGRKVEGLGFFHIPLPEYIDLWNKGETYGARHEGVCSPDVNTGFFDKVLEVGNIRGMFCGHDHSNDFGGSWKGVELVYGRKTGYGGYGPSGLQRGGRIINLKEKEDGTFSYSHRIIQEDLTILENAQPTWQGKNPVKNCNGR
jgi:hypothetical protein